MMSEGWTGCSNDGKAWMVDVPSKATVASYWLVLYTTSIARGAKFVSSFWNCTRVPWLEARMIFIGWPCRLLTTLSTWRTTWRSLWRPKSTTSTRNSGWSRWAMLGSMIWSPERMKQDVERTTCILKPSLGYLGIPAWRQSVSTWGCA